MKRLLFAFILASQLAEAATNPCGAYDASYKSVQISWGAPTTRKDLTPLTASQLGSYVVYLNGNAIVYPGPTATVYTCYIQPGQCIKVTDRWTMTASDTGKLVSAPVLAINKYTSDRCTALPTPQTSPPASPAATVQ